MKNYRYSKELADMVKNFLEEEGWHYSFDENRGIFDMGLKVKCKLRAIRYLIDVREEEILVYGLCPVSAESSDTEMMAQTAEFICRANYGLINGGLELDFRDGEIRYRCYIDCEGGLPAPQAVENSVYCAAAMYERYADGIADIIFGGSSAKAAIDMCEKSEVEEIGSILS